ncbi:MAG: hypothetical protein ACKO18_06645 [Bacteroidota bacterium]
MNKPMQANPLTQAPLCLLRSNDNGMLNRRKHWGTWVKGLACMGLFMGMGCSEPGPGGGGYASIQGVVMVEDWNSTFTTILSRYPAMDERIYLVYGDDPVPGTDLRTSYNGAYRFSYLHTGRYRVYTYSDRFPTSGNTSNQEPVWLDVEIQSRREQVQLDTLWIKK